MAKDAEHIVLAPEAAEVIVPAGKRFLHWNVRYCEGSGGYPTEIVLSAVWEDCYTVTYDANGGVGTPPTDNNQYVQGQTVPLPDGSTLSRPRYRFFGWSTDPASTTAQAIHTIGTANTTLYAVWELKNIGTQEVNSIGIEGATFTADYEAYYPVTDQGFMYSFIKCLDRCKGSSR